MVEPLILGFLFASTDEIDRFFKAFKLDEIVALIRKYDCERHCYFMSRNDAMLQKSKEKYPVIGTCVGAGDRPLEMVERAIAIGAGEIQLVRWAYNQEMINKAHANGIRCNMFWSDDPVEAVEMLKSGIDCILTNDYLAIANATENIRKG